MNNVMFFHVATIGNYQLIVDRVFELLNKSGLYEQLHKVFVNIAGQEKVVINQKNNQKIKIIPERALLNKFEFSTLDLVKLYSDRREANILYIHTKGTGTPSNPCIDDWREYMLYFNICKFSKALELLKENDAVGVDLSFVPTKHFSGNIWWSKTSHIKTLSHAQDLPVVLSERHKAEFWICSKEEGSYTSMHQSDINVYERHLHRYEASRYEDSIN